MTMSSFWLVFSSSSFRYTAFTCSSSSAGHLTAIFGSAVYPMFRECTGAVHSPLRYSCTAFTCSNEGMYQPRLPTKFLSCTMHTA